MNDSSKEHEIENNIWRENNGETENKVVIDVFRPNIRHKTTRTWRIS